MAACTYVQAEADRLAKLAPWAKQDDLERLESITRTEVLDGLLAAAGGGLVRWPWRSGGEPWVQTADLYLALGGWSQSAIRSALARLEAEQLLEGAGGPAGRARAKDAKALRLTHAGIAAAAVMKQPRDRALVLAELVKLVDDNPDLRARLDGYLDSTNDDTDGGVA